MKLLIQELASAIVFVFGLGVIIWLWSTHEVIRDEARNYQSKHHYGAGYVSGELYNNADQGKEPRSHDPNVPR